MNLMLSSLPSCYTDITVGLTSTGMQITQAVQMPQGWYFIIAETKGRERHQFFQVMDYFYDKITRAVEVNALIAR